MSIEDAETVSTLLAQILDNPKAAAALLQPFTLTQLTSKAAPRQDGGGFLMGKRRLGLAEVSVTFTAAAVL